MIVLLPRPALLTFVISALLLSWHGRLNAAIPAQTFLAANYGATPDDRTDDTDAINAAITAASATGGRVLLPAGQLIVNSSTTNRPIRTQSNVRIEGARSAQGDLLTTLFLPRGHTNRTILVIGNPAYASETTDTVTNPLAIQSQIEIAHLRFDLDNDHGRRAIQLRFRSEGVLVENCEGFQSGLDLGEPEDKSSAGDNHFFNLACYGRPGLKEVSRDIRLVDCRVRGGLQLTSDGGAGLIGLRVLNNEVKRAYSHGIAVTTVGKEAYFEDIVIENNRVIEIGGDGLYLGHDEGTTRVVDLKEGGVHVMKDVTIRNNFFAIDGGSGPAANCIRLGSFVEMSDITFERNVIRGYDGGPATSRIALAIYPWDLNWEQQGKNFNLVGSSFQSPSVVRIPGHRFVSGMQVEFRPATKDDVLPKGLEAFRRYIVSKIDADSISLRWARGGPLVKFDAVTSTTSLFRVVFSPAIERLTLRDNSIENTWDYGFRMDGSVNAVLDGNVVMGPVVFALAQEGLKLRGNTFNRSFSFDAIGNSLLHGYNLATGKPDQPCVFEENTWSIDENTTGVVYGLTAVANFDPRDSRRTLAYEFIGNTFTFASAVTQRYRYSLSDKTTAGTIEAVYRNNQYTRATALDAKNALAVLSVPAVYEEPIAPVVGAEQGATTPPTVDAPVPESPVPETPVRTISRLVNLSVRAQVNGDTDPLIAGFVISGSKPKAILVRAAGPTLAQFGVPGFLPDPKLEIYDQATGKQIYANNDWGSDTALAFTVAQTAASVGAFAFATRSKDAGLRVELNPGAYTAVVKGASSSAGIALVEVYDAAVDDPDARLINVSARVTGLRGSQAPIVGFVVKGDTAHRVLLRGSGPALRRYVTATTLNDPFLSVYSSTGNTPFLTNNDWSSTTSAKLEIAQAALAVGAFSFAEGSRDAAAVCDLTPGNYTAIVTDQSNAEGITLLEAYSLP